MKDGQVKQGNWLEEGEGEERRGKEDPGSHYG